MLRRNLTAVLFVGALLVVGGLYAEELTVPMLAVTADGIGKEVGNISALDTPHGLLLTPDLSNLPPGLHGFHVHEHGSCEPADKDGKKTAAQAAGSHLDPQKSGRHEGPYGAGHLGDLPPLFVTAEGRANLPVLAPRLKVADIRGRALMIHQGADNYSDKPEPLGGGGPRIACGVAGSTDKK